jgi:hypothetical protein
LKPRVQITIGELNEWYEQRYCKQHRNKRRRLNKTVDDIPEEDYEGSEGSSQQSDEVELNRTVIVESSASKLNKSLLHENWLEDFEKEKKRQEKNRKKRKRESSSSRSKSRSPTPVRSQNLQFDVQKVN